jgi:hypothetical protein
VAGVMVVIGGVVAMTATVPTIPILARSLAHSLTLGGKTFFLCHPTNSLLTHLWVSSLKSRALM